MEILNGPYSKPEWLALRSRKSYVHNGSDKPLRYTTIGDELVRAALEFPKRLAVISRHQSIKKTYLDLNTEVNYLASSYQKLGLVKGDRVALWGKNSYEWILSAFALAKSGIIMVTVCPAFKESEVKHILETVECKALLIHQDSENFYDILCRIDPSLSVADGPSLNLPKLPHLKTIICGGGKQNAKGTINFDELLTKSKGVRAKEVENVVAPDDVMCIQFTSGTTGRPKPATICHFSVINNGRLFAERMRMDDNFILCCPVPLYHMFGLAVTMGGALSQRGTVVLPSDHFDAQLTFESIETERCSVLLGVEAMLINLMNQTPNRTFDLSSLKIVSLGGSLCRPEVLQKVEKFFEAKPLIGYGITETSGAVTSVDYYDKIDLSSEGICGRVIEHTEVKIVNSDGIVPIGCQGEILIRGFNVFMGYYQQDENTKEVLDINGWYHSGDVGYLDEEGFLHIVCRLKDVIIRGGVNIYPAEVEDYVLKHTAVLDVTVVGVPDSKMGEEMCACVIIDDKANITTEDIRSFLKEKIAYFKVPKYCLFLDYLPKTVSGKVKKNEVLKIVFKTIKIN